MTHTRMSLGCAVVALSSAACTASFQDGIVRDVVEEQVATPSAVDLDQPGLQALVCGSGGPLPAPERAAACIAVVAGGRIYVVDVGAGSSENLGRWRLPMDRLAGVLLSHFHSDHITELGEYNLQSWAAGRATPLPVYGPQGVEKVVDGFNLAYEQSRGYRTAHHGADFLDPDVGLLAPHPFPIGPDAKPGTEVVVLEHDGLVIRAFSVAHEPVAPAVGYRFDYRGRSVVITGDTSASPAVAHAAKKADVLFHDAMAHHLIAVANEAAREGGRERNERITADIPEYHASAVEAAEIANQADVKLLVLYHLVPPPPSYLVETVFLRGVDDVRERGVILASDGLLLQLPPDSGAIDQSMVD